MQNENNKILNFHYAVCNFWMINASTSLLMQPTMPFSTVHTIVSYALNSCKTCNDDKIQIDKKHVPNPKNEATSTVNALNFLAHAFTMTVCTGCFCKSSWHLFGRDGYKVWTRAMNQIASILLDDQETVAIEIYTNLKSWWTFYHHTHTKHIWYIMSAIFYE